jgi:CheY-like chemotaxis protein
LSHTLILALTGHSHEQEWTEQAKSKFDSYLLKPVEPPRLAEIIQQSPKKQSPSS